MSDILTKRNETHNGLKKLESQIKEITKRLGEKALRGEGGERVLMSVDNPNPTP